MMRFMVTLARSVVKTKKYEIYQLKYAKIPT
jgi:hypothetical protein